MNLVVNGQAPTLMTVQAKKYCTLYRASPSTHTEYHDILQNFVVDGRAPTHISLLYRKKYHTSFRDIPSKEHHNFDVDGRAPEVYFCIL